MQKALIALVLAIALSSSLAVNYTATNWSKAPVKILEDTDYNFTNTTSFWLNSMMGSDINVFAYNYAAVINKNVSSARWDLFTKGFDPKDLSPRANASYNFIASQLSDIVSGYTLGYALENDSNSVPQIWLYQTNVADGNTVPRVAMTSNTNASFIPRAIDVCSFANKNVVFFFYQAATSVVKYTSIVIGQSTTGKEFTLSTTWNATTDNLTFEWGEALPISQVFAAYTEAGIYKVAVIDFTTGTLINAGKVAGKYEKTFKCLPYVTDITYYGLLCTNTTNNTMTYFISSTITTELVPLQTVNATTHQFRFTKQYGGDLAIFYLNPSISDAYVASYEIWDVSALKIVKNKTDYLTYNTIFTRYEIYNLPRSGIYCLTYEVSGFKLKSNVAFGQILENPGNSTFGGSAYTATNWARTPLKILKDTDYSYTKASNLFLGGLNTSDLNVFAYNSAVPVDEKNVSSADWNLFSKSVATKDLSANSYSTIYQFTAPKYASIVFGYAVGIDIIKDTNNVSQVCLYQTKLNDDFQIPRVILTKNTNSSYTPILISSALVGETFVFFYQAAPSVVNYISIVLGESTVGTEFTLPIFMSDRTFQFAAAWGAALSSSQVFIAWNEQGAFRVAVVDFITGAIDGYGIVRNYEATFRCSPYVTDQKYYGLWCTNTSSSGLTTVYVSSKTTTELVKMTTFNASTQIIQGAFAYGSHLGFYYINPSSYNATVLSYEIWDPSTLTTLSYKTDFLTYDQSKADWKIYRIPQGGLYALVYKKNGTIKFDVALGQILDIPISGRSITSLLVVDDSDYADFLPLF